MFSKKIYQKKSNNKYYCYCQKLKFFLIKKKSYGKIRFLKLNKCFCFLKNILASFKVIYG